MSFLLLSSAMSQPIVSHWNGAITCIKSNTYFLGTGKAQPADVGLNRVIKHRLKQSQMRFLVNAHQSQIASGLTPKQVRFTTLLPVLRNATVAGLVDVYHFMTSHVGRTLVKKVCKTIILFCNLLT